MLKSGEPLNRSNNADNELQSGVISTQGPLRTNAAQNVFAIVGGTGQFNLARGTMTVQSLRVFSMVTEYLSWVRPVGIWFTTSDDWPYR